MENMRPYIKKTLFICTALLMLSPWSSAQTIVEAWPASEIAKLHAQLADDPDNKTALERLGNIYYYDFLAAHGSSQFYNTNTLEPLEPTFEHAADSALYYFKRLFLLDEKWEYLYYPICQLESNLGLQPDIAIYAPERWPDTLCFPIDYFCNLPINDSNWRQHYDWDLYWEMRNAYLTAHIASGQLHDLGAETLGDNGGETFRVLAEYQPDGGIALYTYTRHRETITATYTTGYYLLTDDGWKWKRGKTKSHKYYGSPMNMRQLWETAGLDTIPVSHAPIMIDGAYFIFEHRKGTFYRAHEESNATEAMEAVVDYIRALAKGKPPKNKKQNHKQ